MKQYGNQTNKKNSKIGEIIKRAIHISMVFKKEYEEQQLENSNNLRNNMAIKETKK